MSSEERKDPESMEVGLEIRGSRGQNQTLAARVTPPPPLEMNQRYARSESGVSSVTSPSPSDIPLLHKVTAEGDTPTNLVEGDGSVAVDMDTAVLQRSSLSAIDNRKKWISKKLSSNTSSKSNAVKDKKHSMLAPSFWRQTTTPDTNYSINVTPNYTSTRATEVSHSGSHSSEPKKPKSAVITEVSDGHMLPMVAKKHHHTSEPSADGEYMPPQVLGLDQSFQKVQTGITNQAATELLTETPHVTIEETQKYTFAIILKHTEQIYKLLRKRFPSKSAASIRRDLKAQVSNLQQKCVRRLLQAGLGVIMLDNDAYNVDDEEDEEERQAGRSICILIDPKKDPDVLVHEFKREMDEVAIKQGDSLERLGEEGLDLIREMCFAPALELQLTHNIIQNALRDFDKEEWVIDVNKELTVLDIVQDIFPLHDRAFNKRFFAEYRSRTLTMNFRGATKKNSDRWAVEELRLHFGERVAFLFAFMHTYTKLLLPLSAFCVLYYLAFRFTGLAVWREYVMGLSVLGFIVASCWGPAFLVTWQRETSVLVEKWNLAKYKNTVYERNDDNPTFQYNWVKNELTQEMEKVPKQRRNHWIQLTMFCFVILSAIVQCVCLLPFIQWYVYAKNAPTCTSCYSSSKNAYSCIWFISCFSSEASTVGTDRWVYILVQGIALGLLIDVIFFEVFNFLSERFVRWENYAKKSEFENRLIHRRFVFVWSNWFFWFLFLAFVYLPFGQYFLMYFKKTGLGVLAPYDWDPTLLTLDTLFVTPLVVTQFLNMLLETIVPYFVRKLRGKPVTCRRGPGAWLVHKFKAWVNRTQREANAQNDVRHLTARRLADLVNDQTQLNVQVMNVSDDVNEYTAYEVIAESKLPIFDPMLDYLDASIQFSYVVMFTIVWPLLPFPAFVNNLLEVRGDAFRLLFAHRRPMPRRDTSIGEWFTVLSYANLVGVTVVSAFVVAYHWGFFMTSCNFTFSNGDMVPFSAINTSRSEDPAACKAENVSDNFKWRMEQIVLFVLLEHVGFCFRYLVLQAEKVPSFIRNSGYQRLKQIQRLTQTRAAPSSQFEFVKVLRELFDKYDLEQDGHLRENELIPFLAEWICKHPSELLPYSSTIFRYMDKNGVGKVPFATCCLMLQHANHDRFFSCLLGLYDPLNGTLNEHIRAADDGIELRHVMSRVSSVISTDRPSENGLVMRDSEGARQRNSSFFYDP